MNDGAISIHYIPTENQLADIGAEFQNKQRLRFLLNRIKNSGKLILLFRKYFEDLFRRFHVDRWLYVYILTTIGNT